MGFGVSSISGIPIVGAAAGFYFIYNAVNGAIQKGKDAEYIKDKGVLAHALKEPELVRYAEIIGPDAAVSEVLQAYQDGQTITAAARKLCIAMGKTPKRRSIATFMEDIKQLQDLPIESGIVGALPGTLQTIATAPTIAGGNCKIRTAVDDMINPVGSSYCRFADFGYCQFFSASLTTNSITVKTRNAMVNRNINPIIRFWFWK